MGGLTSPGRISKGACPSWELNIGSLRPIIHKTTVNTKNWYRKKTDLWAEFGKETSFGRKFSSKHSVKMPAVCSTPSFGRRVVLRLEKEAFGNT
jgi:hypothetical protein